MKSAATRSRIRLEHRPLAAWQERKQAGRGRGMGGEEARQGRGGTAREREVGRHTGGGCCSRLVARCRREVIGTFFRASACDSILGRLRERESDRPRHGGSARRCTKKRLQLPQLRRPTTALYAVTRESQLWGVGASHELGPNVDRQVLQDLILVEDPAVRVHRRDPAMRKGGETTRIGSETTRKDSETTQKDSETRSKPPKQA